MTESHPSPQSRRAFGRLFAAVLAAALILSTAPAARAAPPSAAQSATLTVSPGSITICKGQTGTLKVTARLQTARSRGRRPSRQPPLASTITAVTGTPYASVSPSSSELTFRSMAQLTFRVTGRSVGMSVFRFEMNFSEEDELAPLVGQAPARRPRAHAYAVVYVNVKVTECKYILVLKSKWNIPTAWNYDLSSSLSAELVPDANGIFAAGAIVENTHTQRRQIPGPCSKTPTIERTRANVDGKIDNTSGIIDFKVTYDPVHAANTDVKCRTPFGTIGAQSQGEGLAQVYDPQPVAVNGAVVGGPGSNVSGAYLHDLRTGVGNAQTAGQYSIKTVER